MFAVVRFAVPIVAVDKVADPLDILALFMFPFVQVKVVILPVVAFILLVVIHYIFGRQLQS